jgi:hypothetical protein
VASCHATSYCDAVALAQAARLVVAYPQLGELGVTLSGSVSAAGAAGMSG